MPAEQLAFDEKFDLGFPLLSDPDHATADAWGTWDDARGGIRRSSFLVDEEGWIERAWYGVKPQETVPNAVAALGSLRSLSVGAAGPVNGRGDRRRRPR
jgi:thioredoxin-dependent peroxiredoxin